MRTSIVPGLALASSMTVGWPAGLPLGSLIEVEAEDGDLALARLE